MTRWLRYETFERAIAVLLTVGMAVIIGLAMVHLAFGLWSTVWDYSPDINYRAFQGLFDRVLAALIALELAHSVRQMAQGKHGLSQVRTVVLIGILAVVRKLILLEIETTSGLFLLGLGGAILALGAVYALVLWAETATRKDPPPSPGAPE